MRRKEEGWQLLVLDYPCDEKRTKVGGLVLTRVSEQVLAADQELARHRNSGLEI